MKLKKLIIIPILVVLGIFIFTVIPGYSGYMGTNILNGIMIGDIDASGMSKEALRQVLEDKYNMSINKKEIILKADTTETKISTDDISAHLEMEKTIEKAFSYGHTGSFFKRFGDFWSLLFNKQNIDTTIVYDDEKLTQHINEFCEKNSTVTEFSYTVDESTKTLKMTSGNAGLSIDPGAVKTQVLSHLNKLSFGVIELNYTQVTPNPVNVNRLYKEITAKAVDAKVDYNNGRMIYKKEKYGFIVDKNKFIEAFNKIKDKPSQSALCDAQVIKPRFTVDYLKSKMFTDVLGACDNLFYSYSETQRNRGHNIRLASKKLNNLIIAPGDVFSYNKVVGPRSKETGFKIAGAYSNGEIVSEYGGGVCQTSSSLYNCVLEANLKVIYRKNHTFSVGYVPLGQDATVSHPTVDFKFENSSKFPIKLKAYTRGDHLYVSIIGFEDPYEKYKVELKSDVVSVDPYKIINVYTDDLAAGQKSYIDSGKGHTGYVVNTYRTVYLNGKKISSGILHTSYYKRHDERVLIGTRKSSGAFKPQPTKKPNVPKPTDKPTPRPTKKPTPKPTKRPEPTDNPEPTAAPATPEP